MSSNETIHMLICSESQQDADHYSDLVRGAGYTARVHRVTSSQDLRDTFGDHNWEILIATDTHPEITPDQVVEMVTKADVDLPVIVSLNAPENGHIETLLGAGARDVFLHSDGYRLVHSIKREADGLRNRRALKELEVAYEETARRCELLLKTSQEAIGYVIDGMHIHANDVYAKLFAYDDVDELAGISQMDLIAPDNQQDFKDALRKFRDHPDDESRIEFTGVRGDGSEFAASLSLSTASYEGEACMQVSVRAETGGAPATASPAGPATPTTAANGLDALSSLVADALSTGNGGHLALLMVSGFADHAKSLGLSQADQLMNGLSAWLKGSANWQAAPIRVGADLFVGILAESNGPACSIQAAELTKTLCAKVREVGEQSAQISACMAIGRLDADNAEIDANSIVDETWATLTDLNDAVSAPGGSGKSRSRAAVLACWRAGVLASKASLGEGDVNAQNTLDQAFANNAFKLMFEPIVSLRGDRAEYYEVSIWHESDGESGPIEEWFEKNGINEKEVGTKLDRWEVLEALKTLAKHLESHSDTRLIINLDTPSILDDDFPGWLGVAFKAAELPAKSVTFQLPIEVAGTYLKNAKEFSDRVHGLGCQLSISGIRCNEAHLGTLEHITPVFAKLDNEVTAMLSNAEKVNKDLKPMIESLHLEQMASIMPQVEDAGALAVLWQLGIHYIQGEYLQSAAPAMNYEFTDLA